MSQTNYTLSILSSLPVHSSLLYGQVFPVVVESVFKIFKDLADTTSTGSLFHVSTAFCKKLCFLTLVRLCCLEMF